MKEIYDYCNCCNNLPQDAVMCLSCLRPTMDLELSIPIQFKVRT